jgi:hypothetical protein
MRRLWSIGNDSLLRCALALATTLLAGAAGAEESATKLEIVATLQGDYVQDFNRMEPNWDDTLRPSKIPTEEGAFGGDGQAILSARQSGMGLNATLPAGAHELRTRFYFDLYGSGNNEGETNFHIQHAYGSWGPWLAGQTDSGFMDGDMFPNIIDYWGPNGMVYVRNPQIRYTALNDETRRFIIAIEKPSDDIDPGDIRIIDPDLADNLQSDEEVPDLTTHFRSTGEWGHVQIAGLMRRIGVETIGTPDNEPSSDEFGWGLNLTSGINIGEDSLLLGAVYGEGIASYMNDGGTDLAGEGTLADPEGAATVPLFGMTAYWNHAWGGGWTSAFGYSRVDVDNTSLQSDDAFHIGQYASANLLYQASDAVLIGGELLWGEREDKDGANGDDLRIQITFRYSYSVNNQPSRKVLSP